MIDIRASVIVKYSRPTNTRGDRWIVRDSNGNGRKSYRSHPYKDYQEQAETAARQYLQDMDLQWNLCGATYIPGFGYVFVSK